MTERTRPEARVRPVSAPGAPRESDRRRSAVARCSDPRGGSRPLAVPVGNTDVPFLLLDPAVRSAPRRALEGGADGLREPLDVRARTQNARGGSTALRPQRREAATPDSELMGLREERVPHSASAAQPGPALGTRGDSHGLRHSSWGPSWVLWGVEQHPWPHAVNARSTPSRDNQTCPQTCSTASRNHALTTPGTGWTLHLRCSVLSSWAPGEGGTPSPAGKTVAQRLGGGSYLGAQPAGGGAEARLRPSCCTGLPAAEDRGGARCRAAPEARWGVWARAKAPRSWP